MAEGRFPGRGRLLALVVLALLAACARPAGTPAKLDFVLKDMNGRTVRLTDFRGHPLLINFWATWCPPCKAEIPAFIEFADQYKAEKLTVLGISVDDEPAAIRQFAAQYRVNYPMLVGSGHDDLIAEYEAGLVVPVSWLINADGTVHVKAEGIHPKAWFDAQLREMFARSPELVD